MAYEYAPESITFPANGDLSSNQYYFATISTGGQMQVSSTAARGVAQPIGIILDKTTAAGQSARLGFAGVCKLVCGDSSQPMPSAIVFGTPLVCSSKGQGVPSTATGLHIGAYALANLGTGTSATIIPVIVGQFGLTS